MARVDTRYFLTGLVLTILLVGMVLIVRAVKPQPLAVLQSSVRTKGAENATIKILEYSDFQCPACKIAQVTLSALLNRYPEKVQIVYQHFPIDAHRWSPLAHHAAECAALQNRFWQYHDQLYADQEIWTIAELPVETFMRYAKDLEIDLDQFAQCLKDPKVADRILAERQTGIGLGVRSTPSFFVNGTMVAGIVGLEAEVQKQVENTL